jgi:copper homeostasis protein
MKSFHFELCATSLEAALAAESAGADRVELCSELRVGGLTPSLELIAVTAETLSIPVHVLIRPRDGDFVFTKDEFGQMQRQIKQARDAGARGVVLGILLPDGRVDVERSRSLVELARPMEVTFNRAFDLTPDLSEALEAVIQTGVECLLTSGGAADVLKGAESIARLSRQANTRIQIIAGGGLQLADIAEVLRRTGGLSLHGSLIRKCDGRLQGVDPVVLEADVRETVRIMHREAGGDFRSQR